MRIGCLSVIVWLILLIVTYQAFGLGVMIIAALVGLVLTSA